MTGAPIELLSRPDSVRAALTPIRRRLLLRLREPASATQLATELGATRQGINYHLRAMEAAGLIGLVEERRRRGCVERILAAKGDFLVDPAVMGAVPSVQGKEADQFSPERLIQVAARVVGDVGRMKSRAKKGSRLVTLAIETEVSLAGPSDVGHFTAALASMLARAVAEFDAPTIGQRYRVVIGGHPSARDG